MKKMKILLTISSSIIMLGTVGALTAFTTSCSSSGDGEQDLPAPDTITLGNGVIYLQAKQGEFASAKVPWSVETVEGRDKHVNWSITVAITGETAPEWIYVNQENKLCIKETAIKGEYTFVATATAVKAEGVFASSKEINVSITSPSTNELNYVQIPNNEFSVTGSEISGTGLEEKLEIPKTFLDLPVTQIGKISGSFKSVVIPDSITTIQKSAFSNCEELTDVIIPNTVTSISSSAFYHCTALENVTIGTKVETIGQSAFEGCNKLPKIVIPESVTLIEQYAFKGCSSLTSITMMPAVPPKLKADVFTGIHVDFKIYVKKGFAITYINECNQSANGWKPYFAEKTNEL